MKIVIKSSAHFILDSVEKRAHYVGETHGISDFGFRILDLTADITTEHQLSVISIQNPKSKFQNQDRSKLLLSTSTAIVESRHTVFPHVRLNFA
jgi:hypothetical protein